jgi:hypothetical protein
MFVVDMAIVSAMSLLVMIGCGPARAVTDRPAQAWTTVEIRLKTLTDFEAEFRAAATSMAAKTDTDKLAFVHQALDRRAKMQADLKTALQLFTKEMQAVPRDARLPYVAKLRTGMEGLQQAEAETIPAVKSLGLGRYETELREYRLQADRGAQAGPP